MTTVHLILGIATMASSALAGLVGAVQWWRVVPSTAFWYLVRTSQAILLSQVIIGLLLLAGGKQPADLHLLYGLLPVAVYFIAEQLRVASAETVLESRGLPDAQAVGELEEAEQLSVVTAIVRREMGVMTFAALVVTFLALRAGSVSGGLDLPI